MDSQRTRELAGHVLDVLLQAHTFRLLVWFDLLYPNPSAICFFFTSSSYNSFFFCVFIF